MEDQVERWAPVPGYVGLYEVSTHGRTRSLPRLGNSGRRTYGGRVLKPRVRQDGYLYLTLSKGGEPEGVTVHASVARAFLGEKPDDKDLVAHWDGNRANCRLSNLRWATFAENEADKARHGTRTRGDAVTGSRLKVEQVLAIRASSVGMTTLSRQYGVSKQTISAIRKGRTWTHI